MTAPQFCNYRIVFSVWWSCFGFSGMQCKRINRSVGPTWVLKTPKNQAQNLKVCKTTCMLSRLPQLTSAWCSQACFICFDVLCSTTLKMLHKYRRDWSVQLHQALWSEETFYIHNYCSEMVLHLWHLVHAILAMWHWQNACSFLVF